MTVSVTQKQLLELTSELSQNLTTDVRLTRLLSSIRSVISCDAIVLLRYEEGVLRPLVQQGLTRDVLGRRFTVSEHPRFDEICNSRTPVRFPNESQLPDPYDGMLIEYQGELHVHACMGLPLFHEDQLIGVLTLDSLDPKAFGNIDFPTFAVLTNLTSMILTFHIMKNRMENYSHHSQEVVAELSSMPRQLGGNEIIGNSPIIRQLKKELLLVAPSDYSILIEGETGTGKELVASSIHSSSHRSKEPLVYLNCAALPENLIESELFGHAKGAFTGADSNRAGKFSIANGGTIFLDEIGELPLTVQSKLLRVLQSQEIQPVGKDQTEKVDVRILAATNRKLEHEVRAGNFRSDLYHRLSVYPIHVPPLRERDGDITLLAGYFVESSRRRLGISRLVIAPEAVGVLNQYDWPGNVRELEHVISRAALRAKSTSTDGNVKIDVTHLEHLSASLSVRTIKQDDLPEEAGIQYDLREEVDNFQIRLIQRVLEEENGNWSAAARRLKVNRANLNRLAKRLGIKVEKQVAVSINVEAEMETGL